MSRRKADILLFGLAGAAAFLLLVWIQVHWLEIGARLMGRERIIFDEQPNWLRHLNTAVSATQWVACAALLLFGAMRRRWMPVVAFTGAQVLGWAALFGVILLGPAVKDYSSRIPFDSSVWKSENRQSAEGVRVRMVDDLLRKHTLVGMSRARVDELLGVPPASAYFREYDYVYWLGPERGPFGIDSEWLVLKFNADAVVKAQIVTD